MTGTREFSLL